MKLFIGTVQQIWQVLLPLVISLLAHGVLVFFFAQHFLATQSEPSVSPISLSLTIRHPPKRFAASVARQLSSYRYSGAEKSARSKATTQAGSPQLLKVPLSPEIDLESAYAAARLAAKPPVGQSGAERQILLPLEKETPLGRSISQAARPDCRTAHAGLGLLALPLLLAATDSGCKW